MTTEESLDLRINVLEKIKTPLETPKMMSIAAYITLEYCTTCSRRIGRYQLIVELLATMEKKSIAEILSTYSKALGIDCLCCKLLFLTPPQKDITDEMANKIFCYRCTNEDFIYTNSSYNMHFNSDILRTTVSSTELLDLVEFKDTFESKISLVAE